MPRILLLSLLLLGGVFGADEDEVKSVSVMEGDSVTLDPDLTQIKKFNLIDWRFGDPVIAQIDGKDISYPSHTERFRDRLQLDQTGSLSIRNMRTKHSGLYKAEISHSTGISFRKFNVTIYASPSVIAGAETELKSVSVMEGDPVILQTDVHQLTGDELIVWRFGDEGKLIAKADIETKSSSLYDETDERFRDRLKLDQTGSLTITNTRTTDSGLYIAKISSNKQTSYKRFTVTVSGGVALDGDLQEGWDVHFQCYQSKGSRCCGFTEAVIQLVLSALVGVAGVVILVYEFRTRTRVCGQ